MKVLLIAHMVAALAGAPAHTAIHCDPLVPQQDLGWASLPPAPPRIGLSSKTCGWLRHGAGAPYHRWGITYASAPYFGTAVHVVIHESSHVRGIWDEYAVERRTDRLTPHILWRILHRLHAYSRRVYESALSGANGYHKSLPLCYRKPVAC